MGLFTQNQTQTTSVPDRSPEEQDFLSQLVNLMASTQGQLGDLSGLASGQLPEISDEMRALIEGMGQGQEASLLREAADTRDANLRATDEDFASRGLDRSTVAALQDATIRNNYADTAADIRGNTSDKVLEMLFATPFQQAELGLNANQQLMQFLTSLGTQVNSNYLNDRLARTTTETSSSGGGLGSLMGLGSALAGSGAFGAGGIFTEMLNKDSAKEGGS